jgi:hypothetical protein
VKRVAGRKSQVASNRGAHGSDTEVEWLIAKTEQGISVTGSEKCIVKKEALACDMGYEASDRPNAGGLWPRELILERREEGSGSFADGGGAESQ